MDIEYFYLQLYYYMHDRELFYKYQLGRKAVLFYINLIYIDALEFDEMV